MSTSFADELRGMQQRGSFEHGTLTERSIVSIVTCIEFRRQLRDAAMWGHSSINLEHVIDSAYVRDIIKYKGPHVFMADIRSATLLWCIALEKLGLRLIRRKPATSPHDVYYISWGEDIDEGFELVTTKSDPNKEQPTAEGRASESQGVKLPELGHPSDVIHATRDSFKSFCDKGFESFITKDDPRAKDYRTICETCMFWKFDYSIMRKIERIIGEDKIKQAIDEGYSIIAKGHAPCAKGIPPSKGLTGVDHDEFFKRTGYLPHDATCAMWCRPYP